MRARPRVARSPELMKRVLAGSPLGSRLRSPSPFLNRALSRVGGRIEKAKTDQNGNLQLFRSFHGHEIPLGMGKNIDRLVFLVFPFGFLSPLPPPPTTLESPGANFFLENFPRLFVR